MTALRNQSVWNGPITPTVGPARNGGFREAVGDLGTTEMRSKTAKSHIP